MLFEFDLESVQSYIAIAFVVVLLGGFIYSAMRTIPLTTDTVRSLLNHGIVRIKLVGDDVDIPIHQLWSENEVVHYCNFGNGEYFEAQWGGLWFKALFRGGRLISITEKKDGDELPAADFSEELQDAVLALLERVREHVWNFERKQFSSAA